MRVPVRVFNGNQRKPVNILVLVSGRGANLQALIEAEKEERLGPGHIAAVISDRNGAYALERARAAGITTFIETINRGLPAETRRRDLSDRLLDAALRTDAGLIVLAGFLSIVEGEILKVYENRIINIHPSLLPKYGGKGMYGDRVHRAVLAAGEQESGCTVHLADPGTDTGPVLLQRRVPVLPDDTVESLAERIHGEEHIAIVEATALMARKLQ
jgi:phosphoribosylglycinamide formyltransferase-1